MAEGQRARGVNVRSGMPSVSAVAVVVVHSPTGSPSRVMTHVWSGRVGQWLVVAVSHSCASSRSSS